MTDRMFWPKLIIGCLLAIVLVAISVRLNTASTEARPSVKVLAPPVAGSASMDLRGDIPRTLGVKPERPSPVVPSPLPEAIPRTLSKRAQIEKSIGSEGYGPHIMRALQNGSPEEALIAAHWIESCRNNAELQIGIERLRSKPDFPPHLLKQSIELFQDIGRKCQTVTPDLSPLAGPLALKALKAGQFGAAAYYERLAKEPYPIEEAQLLLVGLKRDAELGDSSAIGTLAVRGRTLGLSLIEAYAYRYVALELQGETFKSFPFDVLFSTYGGPLSESDKMQAQEEAKRIIGRIKIGTGK